MDETALAQCTHGTKRNKVGFLAWSVPPPCSSGANKKKIKREEDIIKVRVHQNKEKEKRTKEDKKESKIVQCCVGCIRI